MTEQELREQFENNKELFPNHPMDEGEVIKRKLFTKNEHGDYSWNDIRRDFKSFTQGYSLAQETIKAKDELLVHYFKENTELKETIENQKKEIEGKSHLLSIALDQIKAKDMEILKAREIVSGFWSWFHIKSTRTAPNEFLEKAKVWLESNK